MRIAQAFGLLLLAGAAGGGDGAPEEQPTPRGAAVAVVEASRGGDAQALRTLAAADRPDPWLVADELCSMGEIDAATAFAAAAVSAAAVPKALEALPAYVASRRGSGPRDGERNSLRDAEAALARGDAGAALGLLETAGEGADDVLLVQIQFARGHALRTSGQPDASAAAFDLGARVAVRLGWLTEAARGFHECGKSTIRSDPRKTLKAWSERMAIDGALGRRQGVATGLHDIGMLHRWLGDLPRALEFQTRALRAYEELQDRRGVAMSHAEIASIRSDMGEFREAMDLYRESLSIFEALGDKDGAAMALGNLGLVLAQVGECRKALAQLERAQRVHEEVGDEGAISGGLVNLGSTYLRLGDYRKALEHYEAGREIATRIGHRRWLMNALMGIGLVQRHKGAFAEAIANQKSLLAMQEQSGDRRGASGTLVNLGTTHACIGASEEARAYLERGLRLKREIGDKEGVAIALGNLASLYERAGDSARAIESRQEALSTYESIGSRDGVARELGNIASFLAKRGEAGRALEYYGRCLALFEESGNCAGVAQALRNIGEAQRRAGDPAKALETLERSRSMAAEIGALDVEVRSMQEIATVRLSQRDARGAADLLRDCVERLPLLVGRLGDEQGAQARDLWAAILEQGILAGLALDDPEELSFFLESGRAGALLEALGGRDAIQDAPIPEELRRAEVDARDALRRAQEGLTRAIGTGRRDAIAGARDGLDAARRSLLGVVTDIQRTSKAVADVAYPHAAKLREIAANLSDGEALVSYGFAGESAAALVVTPKGSRIVRLAGTPEIEAAVRALAPHDPAQDPSAPLAALRRLLVEPLGLDPATKRLLVSPAGALSAVPMCALAGGVDVVYVASGTTHGVLLDEKERRGTQVLALGDPDYAKGAAPRGGRLAPLPGTREEAKAVGDVVLLGADATPARLLAAVAGHPRWRAIHLACHGLLDAERPMLSSLALADGALSMHDVLRSSFPGDLVVLSACETGRGKVYRAEGILGLNRAFMLAGAPRVVVSLWKVDDEATRALMVKFYELWKEGGAETATALRKAQEFVASHEAWRHPFYWAAWQLWGLAD